VRSRGQQAEQHCAQCCNLQVRVRRQPCRDDVLLAARSDLGWIVAEPGLNIIDHSFAGRVVDVKVHFRHFGRNLTRVLAVHGAQKSALRAVMPESRLPVTKQGHVGSRSIQLNSFSRPCPNLLLSRVTASIGGSNEPAQCPCQSSISLIEQIHYSINTTFCLHLTVSYGPQ
jgi:hypothetical protein